MSAITQEQLVAFLKIFGQSKLISELLEQSTLTTDSNYLVINQGQDDAKKIKIPLIRGFKGNYNASTNTPSLSNGIGLVGDYYTISVSGNRDFGNGFINLIVDDIIWYNGSKYIKLTQSQISDIVGLQNTLDAKASLNGDANENFKATGGTEQDDVVVFGQLESVATFLKTGDSFYVDNDGKLWGNVSIYRQVIDYVSGSQTFTLDFEPTFFVAIYVNGVFLDQSQYTYTSPNQLEILGTMEENDKLVIVYEKFVNPPII